MKHLLFLILSAAFFLSLSACGPELTEQQRLAANAAHVYLSSDIFGEMERAYEEKSGQPAREPTILRAAEYHLDDLDGFSIHAILLALQSDVLCDGQTYETTYLFIDLPSSTIYDDKALNLETWRADFGGTCRNGYDALALVFDRYAAFSEGNSQPMISESELFTEFTQEDISIIMQTVAQKSESASSNP